MRAQPRHIPASVRGLTIIELMAVVSIVSILAVIALATYQDYATRAKVAEGIGFAAEAKTTVSEYYYSNNRFPESNRQAGLPAPDNYENFNHLERLEIRSNEPRVGTIEITFSIPNLGADNLLHLVPRSAEGIVTWSCQPAAENGIENNRVPPNCRGG